MSAIKNILFDLGNVLLNFNHNNARNYFIEIGVEDYDIHFNELYQLNIFNDIETGILTPEIFINTISQQLNGAVSGEHITKAWNAILMDFRKESMMHVERLKERYDVYLLSNTNAIHLDEINRMLQNQLQVQNLNQYFKKAYYSHLIGFRKPDKRSYEFVLDDAHIFAEETLFIDDLSENIEAAAAIGFKTHLLLPGERIENLKTLAI